MNVKVVLMQGEEFAVISVPVARKPPAIQSCPCLCRLCVM